MHVEGPSYMGIKNGVGQTDGCYNGLWTWNVESLRRLANATTQLADAIESAKS
jgi:hypothetical protein